MKEYGKRVWIFPDAELPPEGVNVIPGHESIILTNVTDETANVTITLLYEDREPVSFPVTSQTRPVSAHEPRVRFWRAYGGDR